MPKKFFKKPKNTGAPKGLTPLLMRVFERNLGIEFTHKDLCTRIDANNPANRQQVFDTLIQLAKKNVIKQVSHTSFKLEENKNSIEGRIELTQRGSGFVVMPGESKDIFISPNNIGQAMHNDKVIVRLINIGKGRPEGVVIKIIERDKTQFVGTILLKGGNAFLVPDNPRAGVQIKIIENKLSGATNGVKALVKITIWPQNTEIPFGEVVAVLGFPGSNDVEMLSILYNQGIDPIFPSEVLDEAEYVSIQLDETEIAKRRDFRDVLTFTIDPFDAKDFDDAISYKKLENGRFELGVHIADVSHYVRAGSSMDTEALKRSNSVYLVDRVIPMLPEQLSNIACSLRPHEDKYSFSAVFQLNSSGEVEAEWFGKTVIHSNRRYSYEDAQEIIEGKEGEYQEEIREIDRVAKILRKARLANGALNIESEEMRFKLDDGGAPVETIIKTSKDAHKLIEEFMLLANKHVSLFLSKPKGNKDLFPMIYRVHDKPDPEKIGFLKLFLEKFELELAYEDIDKIALNINALLKEIREENEFPLVQSMVIRSMSKATYETQNIGHFGLAFTHYSHFTSPIRRYADLVVHRILETELSKRPHQYGHSLDDVCKLISRNERKAAEAERESGKYFQTLFVQDKIGEEFDGFISGIAEHGLYVKMIENNCEGMVSMQDIPGDRYYFDAEKFRVVGVKNKKEYNFGDLVKVRIYEVNPRKRQIDLELVV
ncbi:MAG: ribonuclease R [Flavobacteriia bacterium]|nr:ribonuclease R [Flavobacteriia bacterium]